MTKVHAILSAYTGFLLGDFAEMHEYIEKVMDRPVFTHELADKDMQDQIREKIKERGDLTLAVAAIDCIEVSS